MEINVYDYLSREEITQIVKQHLLDDYGVCYDVLREVVKDVLKNEVKEQLVSKVKEIVENIKFEDIFGYTHCFVEDPMSNRFPPRAILADSLRECSPYIQDRIKTVFDNKTDDDLLYQFSDSYNAVIFQVIDNYRKNINKQD